MKRFEIITGIIALIALVLNFLHIPGAVILMMLSFGILSIFYFLCTPALLSGIPFSLDLLRNNMYGKTNETEMLGTPFMRFVARLTGYSLAMILMGILLKIMHLPGAVWINLIMLCCLCCLAVIAIILIIKYVKTRSLFYVGIIVRIMIISALGLSFSSPRIMYDIYKNPPYSKATTEETLEQMKFPKVKNLSEYENTIFLPTLEYEINPQKNSVYCVTLLYAWDEVRKIINEPLIISEEYKDLLLLNNSKSYMNVLKDNEYSTNVTIRENHIRARAEFYKSLPLGTKLKSYDNKLTFKGTPVASFGVHANDNYRQLKTVRIIYYKDDNNFIIKLFPKDKSHEIILFKTDKVFHSIAEMNEEIFRLSNIGKVERENGKSSWKYTIEGEDEVVIPKFNFNIKTNYTSLEGKTFKTSNQYYRIDSAWQRTAFLLDENGTEIESEAEIKVVKLSIEKKVEKEEPRPKKMIFDKDFLILLKRTDSQNPYFGLWVVNTELMKK